MEAQRFDYIARIFSRATARRRLLFGLGLSPFAGLIAARQMGETEAKKKRRKPKKAPKPVFNEFGCLDVGQPCQGKSALCCSGVCQGKKPKKGKRDKSRCVAHDASTCLAGQRSDSCGGSVDELCTTSTGVANGACNTTTGNAGYCHASTACFACATDAECKPVCGERAACLTCTTCAGTGGTMCASSDAGACSTSM
jgi:hypothetical protein